MNQLKSLTLIFLLALVGVSCGTDGLQVNEKPITFTNVSDDDGELKDLDYVAAGDTYTYTIEIDGDKITKTNLTTVSGNGNWLNAEVVDDGHGLKLSGTPSSSDAGTEYSYTVSGYTQTENSETTSFAVYVDD